MKKVTIFLIAVVLTLIGAGSCTNTEVNPEEEIVAIQNVYLEYEAACEAGDLESFMACWDENARRSEPDIQTIVGKEAIREHFKTIFELSSEIKIDVIDKPDVEVRDDLGYGYTTATLTVFPADSSDMLQHDLKVLSIFKKQDDGKWKFFIDCVNYNPTWSLDSIPDELTEKNPYY